MAEVDPVTLPEDEERQRHIAQYLHDEHNIVLGTHGNTVSKVDGKTLHLGLMYRFVTGLGGYWAVTTNMKWVVVKGMFCFSKPLSSAGFQIKRTYETYVLEYERRFYDQRARTPPTHAPPRTASASSALDSSSYLSHMSDASFNLAASPGGGGTGMAGAGLLLGAARAGPQIGDDGTGDADLLQQVGEVNQHAKAALELMQPRLGPYINVPNSYRQPAQLPRLVLALRSHCAGEVAWALNALAVLSACKTPGGAIRVGRQDPSTTRHNLVDALVTLVHLGMLKVAPPEYDDGGSPEELWRSGWWWEGEEDLFAPAGDGEEAEGTAQHTRVHRALAAANVLHNLTLQAENQPEMGRSVRLLGLFTQGLYRGASVDPALLTTLVETLAQVAFHVHLPEGQLAQNLVRALWEVIQSRDPRVVSHAVNALSQLLSAERAAAATTAALWVTQTLVPALLRRLLALATQPMVELVEAAVTCVYRLVSLPSKQYSARHMLELVNVPNALPLLVELVAQPYPVPTVAQQGAVILRHLATHGEPHVRSAVRQYEHRLAYLACTRALSSASTLLLRDMASDYPPPKQQRR